MASKHGHRAGEPRRDRMHGFKRKLVAHQCRIINRYCVTHDVGVWDDADTRDKCPTFAD